MRHHFKDSAYGVAGPVDLVDHGLHFLLGFGIDAAQKESSPAAQRDDLLPGRRSVPGEAGRRR